MASTADGEEAVIAAPRPCLEQLPGASRYSLTGVHAGSLGEVGSAGAGSCSKAEVGAPWESPGPRTDGPGLATVSCVSRSLTQSVTPRQHRETFAATEAPPQPLSARLTGLLHGRACGWQHG